jgi:hypothetical protein
MQARRRDNDAKDAVEASTEAVEHTPESHANWGTFQFNLSRALRGLSERAEEDMNLE